MLVYLDLGVASHFDEVAAGVSSRRKQTCAKDTSICPILCASRLYTGEKKLRCEIVLHGRQISLETRDSDLYLLMV
jgi:hypothetical protein